MATRKLSQRQIKEQRFKEAAYLALRQYQEDYKYGDPKSGVTAGQLDINLTKAFDTIMKAFRENQ